MVDDRPPAETPAASTSGQEAGPAADVPLPSSQTVASTGRRQVFLEIRRQLSDADLGSAGVQKMLLDELERTEAECEELETYVTRFHEADKKAAVLEERMRAQNAIEVMFAVGVGVGGAALGLAPVFWSTPPQGQIVLAVGVLLVVGATVGRAIKR
jgi:hypothetical protein